MLMKNFLYAFIVCLPLSLINAKIDSITDWGYLSYAEHMNPNDMKLSLFQYPK